MARSAVARRAAALALCLLGPAAGPAVCTIVPQEAWAPVPDGHRPPVVEWVGAVPPEAAELHAHPERFTELLESQGLLLDLSSRSVTARGGALHDAASLSYPVEYVLVTERGKTHEALFVLKAQPSLLDACLRAIGLHPGVPMRYVLRDPPPSAAEQEAGVSPWEPLPAYGPIVSIDVAWTDDTGAPRRAPLDSLLEDVRTGEALAEAGWVFVGSRYGPLRQGQRVVQTHLPDLTGNIVATYLTGEGTSLFERNSLEGIDDSLYTLHAGQAPARGTPVSLIFRATGRSTEAPPPERSDAVVLGERGERLDHWLSALVPWGFSGVVLVKEAGNVVLHQAYGLADRRTALPMSTASVFPWSAVAQEMVAVAVLQLVQRGALGLDDSLVRHLRHVPDDKAAITVRQLLEHRSGLPADVAGAATIGRAEALRALLAAPLVFPPGERVQVSGPGYALLIALVEEVAEDTWSPYAAENLLGPARMTSSGLWGEPRWDGRRLARGHAQGQDVGTPAERVPTWADLGAGAFIAPVRDIARWQEALDSETLLDEPHRQLLRALAPDSGREPPRTPGFTTQSLSGPVLLAANGEWQGVAEAVRRLAQGSELPLPPAAPSSPADVAAAAEVRLVEGREPGELCVQILAADGTVLAENPPRDG